jgi:hypothetical protein
VLLLSPRRAGSIHVNEHDLAVYLKALHNQLSTVALHPAPKRLVSSWGGMQQGRHHQ